MSAVKKPFFVLYEEEDFLIIVKSRGISCTPLKKNSSESPDLCTLVFEQYPQIRQVHGKNPDEGGLMHRLDRDTEGLILFAKNKDFYHHIRQQSAQDLFKKSYLAHCTRKQPDLPPVGYTKNTWAAQLENFGNINCIFSCFFVKAAAHTARVRPIQHHSSHSNNKLYTTEISLNQEKKYIRAVCTLSRGFRHQVRASLCTLGLPIIGDPFYPLEEEKTEPFSFWATDLSFIPRGSKTPVQFRYNPKDFVNRF